MSAVRIYKVEKKDAGLRLDKWFKANYPDLPFGHLSKLLRTGQVRLNGRRVKGNERLAAGDEIRIPPIMTEAKTPSKPRISEAETKRIRDMVIHEDSELIALNKPAGLAVQGGSGMKTHVDGMLAGLKAKNAAETPKLVHRLDKDTSGVLVVAKSRQSAARLAKAFKARDCHKIYWALVKGVPDIRKGRIDLALIKGIAGAKEKMLSRDEGKKAVTYYKVIDHAGEVVSWVALVPLTGRTHQLRAHMAAIGHPIVGDGKYGGREAHIGGLSGKLHLHAAALAVPASSGPPKQFSAPLPPHMKDSFHHLGFEENEVADPFEGLEI